MDKISFKCEVITPMFISGADGKTPELRTPSIKGLMRFWWRAMNGNLSINELKKREAEIFGGSGEKEGRSKVVIRVKTDNEPKKGNNIKNDYKLNWNFDSNKKTLIGKEAGIGYLLYSTVLGNGRAYIRDDQNFIVELKSNEINALKQVIASFWGLAYLGGIGTRSRRGGGNITIIEVEDKCNILNEMGLKFLISGEKCDEIADWIVKNYEIAKTIVNEKKETEFISEYSNLSISRFIISNNGFSNWKDALNDIGSKFAEYRVKNKQNVFDTAAFGLPRSHIEIKDIKRRSSPLIFKVLKINNEYYWFVLRLAGEFLPEGKVLKEKNSNKTEKANYNSIEEFWNILKKEGSEHILSLPDRITKIKKKLKDKINSDKVIIFGSKARGDFHKKSDIDIAVDTEKDIELADINGAVDLIKLNKVNEKLKDKIEKEGIEL